MDVARSAPQGLTNLRTLFTCFPNWEQRREQGPYDTPNSAFTNSVTDEQSLYPDGQHTRVFYTKCAPIVWLQQSYPNP